MKKDLLKGLTEEQITKVKACKNQEEDFTCPKCGSKKIKTKYNENSIAEWWNNTCQDCGFVWIVNK